MHVSLRRLNVATRCIVILFSITSVIVSMLYSASMLMCLGPFDVPFLCCFCLFIRDWTYFVYRYVLISSLSVFLFACVLPCIFESV